MKHDVSLHSLTHVDCVQTFVLRIHFGMNSSNYSIENIGALSVLEFFITFHVDFVSSMYFDFHFSSYEMIFVLYVFVSLMLTTSLMRPSNCTDKWTHEWMDGLK